MIRCKSQAVRLNFASEPIRRLVRVLGEMHAQAGGYFSAGDLVITSGNDGRHSVGSRHYTDEAIDVRTHSLRSRSHRRQFRERYEQALGPQFRVLLEHEGTANEHLHAQVVKGHTYRPEGY